MKIAFFFLIAFVFQVKSQETINQLRDLKNMYMRNDEKGYEYIIESGTIDFPHRDSLVYQIKNGKRTGKHYRFRRYLNTSYYLHETGEFKNYERTGLWISNEVKLGIFDTIHYKNDERNGYYYRRMNSNNTIEFGIMKKNNRNGLWIKTDTNKLKIEESYYKSGFKSGLSISYNKIGRISEKGNFIQVKGYREYMIGVEKQILVM